MSHLFPINVSVSLSGPGKVSDLEANNTENVLMLHWVRPEGNSTGFRVKAVNGSDQYVFEDSLHVQR